MPYLRLSSLPLDEETKRHLADELTATVLDILPDQKPEWTSVHFTSFEPSDFAIAGRLVADGGIADTHLEISAADVDERAWRALRNRLTDVLVEELGISEADRWHVNVKLNVYEPHSIAVAGNATDELPAPEPFPEPSSPANWRTRVTLLGMALGALAAYYALSRVATNAEVDTAPPPEPTTARFP